MRFNMEGKISKALKKLLELINRTMKKGIIYSLLAIIVTTLGLIYFFSPRYSFKYMYSSDNKSIITRIDKRKLGKNDYKTIFTPGKYNKKDIPEIRIVPQYSFGITSGFLLLLEWKKDTAIIYSMSIKCETNNLSDKFKFIRLNGHKESDTELWHRMRNDTTGKYIELYDR